MMVTITIKSLQYNGTNDEDIENRRGDDYNDDNNYNAAKITTTLRKYKLFIKLSMTPYI